MKNLPNKHGYFGIFGGRFVPETLIYALDELTRKYLAVKKDPKFKQEFYRICRTSHSIIPCPSAK
jgi:tryptophan synthase beta chain